MLMVPGCTSASYAMAPQWHRPSTFMTLLPNSSPRSGIVNPVFNRAGFAENVRSVEPMQCWSTPHATGSVIRPTSAGFQRECRPRRRARGGATDRSSNRKKYFCHAAVAESRPAARHTRAWPAASINAHLPAAALVSIACPTPDRSDHSRHGARWRRRALEEGTFWPTR
jgi:hypothetical protein